MCRDPCGHRLNSPSSSGSWIAWRTTTLPRWACPKIITADNCVTLCTSQGLSVNTLIALGFSDKAFDLAVRFNYFLGIMVAALDVNQSLLRPQLHQVLSENGDLEAIVDPFPRVIPLATFCYEWLENHGRFADLLEIGKYAQNHLQSFLRVIVSKSITSYCQF